MAELKVLRRGEETSSPDFPQNRRRRASDMTVRMQSRAPGADPLPRAQSVADVTRVRDEAPVADGTFPEPVGSLLIVRDPAGDRQVPTRAARLAGLQVLQANTPEEALQILGEKEFPVDLLLILPHPSMSSPAADLIRKSVATRPGLPVLMMLDSGQREEMRTGYAAGATSIILSSLSAQGLTAFLKQSLSAAREGRRQELRRWERGARHASESPARRGIRKIRSWAKAPIGSRRRAGLAALAAAALALLFGMGVAFALEGWYRARDREESMANRILEGMNRFKGPANRPEAAILYGQTAEQIGLAREANEVTRRYYQDHLQELRWQNSSRSDTPSKSVAGSTPDRDPRFIPIQDGASGR